MGNGTIAAIAAGVIVIAVVLWYVSTRNRFARLAVKITESDSGIDVALTKRYDTLTKMLDVTKGYAKHEAETLVNVVRLRGGMSMLGCEKRIREPQLKPYVKDYPNG